MQPRHYTEFKGKDKFYPGETPETGSWVSDNEGSIYPLHLTTGSIDDSIVDTGREEIKLADFRARHGLRNESLFAVGTYGANRGPSVINKFINRDMPLSLITIRGKAISRDPVYEARVTLDGRVPLILIASEGTMPDFYLNLLTPWQLHRMHETEGCTKEGPRRYELGELPGILLDNGVTLPKVYVYVANGRICNHQGKPYAPASEDHIGTGRQGKDLVAYRDFMPVNAMNRVFEQMAQSEMMDMYDSYVSAHLGFHLYTVEEGPEGLVYNLNPELVGPKDSEQREKLGGVNELLSREYGMSHDIDLPTVADPWDIKNLNRFNL